MSNKAGPAASASLAALRPGDWEAGIRRMLGLRPASRAAHKALWKALRRQQIDGARFRRQRQIGPYTIDFVCLSASLVIELEAAQAAEPLADIRRARWLQGRGFHVLRFGADTVLNDLPGVVHTVSAAYVERSPVAIPKLRPRQGAG